MKQVFEYISGMTQKLYEVKCVDARISELKSNIEAIKLEIDNQKQKEGELKTEFSELLTQADTYGLTKKSAQSVVEENLETMIGNGILTIEASDKGEVVASAPSEPKLRRARKSKNAEVAPEPAPVVETVTPTPVEVTPEPVVVEEKAVVEGLAPIETVVVDDGATVYGESVTQVVEELKEAPVSEAVETPVEDAADEAEEAEEGENSGISADELVSASAEEVVEKAEEGDKEAEAEVQASVAPAPMSMPKVPAFLTMRKK